MDAKLKLGSGSVYNGDGLPILGEVDSATGKLRSSSNRLKGQYHLASWPYSILQCPSCNGHFVAEANRGPVWPPPNVTVPEEIPEGMARLVLDAKRAHAADAEIAAMLAARSALARMWRIEKCDSLEDLQEAKKITAALFRQAEDVHLWERAIGEEEITIAPERADVDQLLRYMDLLFDTLYVQPARLRALVPVEPRQAGGQGAKGGDGTGAQGGTGQSQPLREKPSPLRPQR